MQTMIEIVDKLKTSDPVFLRKSQTFVCEVKPGGFLIKEPGGGFEAIQLTHGEIYTSLAYVKREKRGGSSGATFRELKIDRTGETTPLLDTLIRSLGASHLISLLGAIRDDLASNMPAPAAIHT